MVAAMLIATVCAIAQPYCKVRTFTIDNGLAANNIAEFTQSADGMIWVATWNGLCNYDGYSFSTFRDKLSAPQTLSSNRIKLIRPTAHGDIWCSTYDGGTYIFDCSTCRYIDVGQIISKRFNLKWVTRNILTMGNGYAWVLSNGNLCVRIDENKVKQGDGLTLIDTNKMRAKGRVRKVEADGKGREWLFADNGVSTYGSNVYLPHKFEYMEQTGSGLFFASPTGQFGCYAGRLTMLPLNGGISKVNDIVSAGNTLAIATDKGVLLYYTATHRQQLVPIKGQSGRAEEVTNLFTDSRQRIYAFTATQGVTLINTANGKSRWLQSTALGWLGTYSRDPLVHEDAQHTVWIVPRSGVFSYLDERTLTLVPYNLNAENNIRLPLSYIVKYRSDAQGNLWLTGNHNLILVNFSRNRFIFAPTLAADDTRAILRLTDGRTLTGTHSGFITVHDASWRLLGYITLDGKISPTPKRFTACGVYALHQRCDGTVWIGTKGEGALRLTPNGQGFNVERFRHNESDKQSLSGDNVYDFCDDSIGRLWVACYGGGLNLVDERGNGGTAFINSNNTMKPLYDGKFDKMRRLTLLNDGVMAASTNAGLVTFRPKKDVSHNLTYYYTTHISGDTTSLYAADVLHTYLSRATGRLYVTTLGGGLQVTNGRNLLRNNLRFSSVKGFDAEEGTVQSVTEDAQGNLWLVRESTVDKLCQHTGRCEVYGSDDWKEAICFTEAKPCVYQNGNNIMLGVTGGTLRFNPASVRKSNYKPLIVFSGVQFQGDRQVTPILGKTVLDIPADERNATIYFSALDYTGNRLTRYAYKIKEIDTEWSYTGTSHSASLNHIPAGHYTLIVRSTNADGVWTGSESSLSIHVHPTFWETGWAWLLYIIIAFGVMFGVLYVWRLRYKVDMEKRLKERQLKFFTDISHQLRTPLTLIDGPVSQVLEDEPLSNRARTYLEFVRRNAMRMLDLVNKALDFKWLDSLDNSGEQPSNRADEDKLPIETAQPATAEAANGNADGRTTMLIVEDNDELRYFLVSTLAAEYNVTEARNGQEGLDLAKQQQPEFIITDIMMPVMDGMTMIRRIKTDPAICHIPIIVLSARTAESSRIEGLNEGIDDYITKPFSMQYLRTRVTNIIRQRRQLQQQYVNNVSGSGDGNAEQQGDTPQYSAADKVFTASLMSCMERVISDSELKIDDIARAVGVSRTVLYGKVKSLFGMSPIDFVRHMRLTKAAKLITETQMSFSEIAYAVGFTDPKYFSRTFKQQTGYTPSEYRRQTV